MRPAIQRLGFQGALRRGFTLLEVMVSVIVLVILLGIILGVTNMTSATIRLSSAKLDAFQTSQIAFDTIARRLSQATLNTYWDYDSATAPTKYVRKSDLDFLVLAPGGSHSIYFQTPGSFSQNASYSQASGLLNVCGYYVQYGNDDGFRPALIAKKRWRYRLMQVIQPTESMTVFSLGGSAWTTALLPGASGNPAWPLADNVIALVVWPRQSNQDDPAGTVLAPKYAYDSRAGSAIQLAQLPPMIQLTMVAISEEAALRLDAGEKPSGVLSAALAGKFTNAAEYQGDLDSLAATLAANRVAYRILNTAVMMRESKWSSQ